MDRPRPKKYARKVRLVKPMSNRRTAEMHSHLTEYFKSEDKFQEALDAFNVAKQEMEQINILLIQQLMEMGRHDLVKLDMKKVRHVYVQHSQEVENDQIGIQ